MINQPRISWSIVGFSEKTIGAAAQPYGVTHCKRCPLLTQELAWFSHVLTKTWNLISPETHANFVSSSLATFGQSLISVKIMEPNLEPEAAKRDMF